MVEGFSKQVENTMGKGEITPFPTVFSRKVVNTMGKGEITPFPTVFSLDLYFKNQGLSGIRLTHSHTMTPFDAPGKQAF